MGRPKKQPIIDIYDAQTKSIEVVYSNSMKINRGNYEQEALA